MNKKTLLMSISALALMCSVASCGHEHEFGSSWEKDATHHWHAAVCEHAEEVADKAAHTWDAGTVTKEATEEAKGEKTFKCTVCSATKTEEIAQLAHTHKFAAEWSKDATHHWHAATCGHEEVDSKAEHAWDAGTVTKEATEEAKGEKTFKCTVCSATKTEEIAQLAHTHKFAAEWSKDATHHWHAATCGHEEVDSKAEHTWNEGTVTKQPTLSEAGEKEFKCTECGQEKVEAVPALEAKLVLNASDLEVGDIAAGTIVESNGFTLISDNPAQEATKIDKYFTVSDDVNVTIGEEKFTQRIKTNGGSNTKVGTEERVISFTTTGQGKATVYLKHGSSDESKAPAKILLISSENGVQHDAAEVAVADGAVAVELETHYAGKFYLASTDNVSIYKIVVEWEDGVNDFEWEPPLEISDPNFLNVSELPTQIFEKDVTIGNFVVNAGVGKEQSVTIDANKKTFDGIAYTARLKLGGLGTEDYRSVTINVDGPATILIVVCSSDSSAERTANLFDAAGNAVADTDAKVTTGLIQLIFDVTEAGAYNFRVTGGGGGANIYSIAIEPTVA